MTHCITVVLCHLQHAVNGITSLDDTWERILRCEPDHDLLSQSSLCSHLVFASNTCATLCKFSSQSLSFLVYKQRHACLTVLFSVHGIE